MKKQKIRVQNRFTRLQQFSSLLPSQPLLEVTPSNEQGINYWLFYPKPRFASELPYNSLEECKQEILQSYRINDLPDWLEGDLVCRDTMFYPYAIPDEIIRLLNEIHACEDNEKGWLNTLEHMGVVVTFKQWIREVDSAMKAPGSEKQVVRLMRLHACMDLAMDYFFKPGLAPEAHRELAQIIMLNQSELSKEPPNGLHKLIQSIKVIYMKKNKKQTCDDSAQLNYYVAEKLIACYHDEGDALDKTTRQSIETLISTALKPYKRYLSKIEKFVKPQIKQSTHTENRPSNIDDITTKNVI